MDSCVNLLQHKHTSSAQFHWSRRGACFSFPSCSCALTHPRTPCPPVVLWLDNIRGHTTTATAGTAMSGGVDHQDDSMSSALSPTKSGLERFQLRTITLNRAPDSPFGFILKGMPLLHAHRTFAWAEPIKHRPLARAHLARGTRLRGRHWRAAVR